MNAWELQTNQYKDETHLHDAPVYTIGNGLMGCRGFFEEQQEGIAALGGIYMARIFGRADYQPWSGVGRELVNIPNFFQTRISLQGKPVHPSDASIADFEWKLDMQNGVLHRSYTYITDGAPVVKLRFERFFSNDNAMLAGQKISVEAVAETVPLELLMQMNPNVTNLNMLSSEPWPVQPGKKQYECIDQTADQVVVQIPKPEKITLGFAQQSCCELLLAEKTDEGHLYRCTLSRGQSITVEKLVAVANSVDDGDSIEEVLCQRVKALGSYAHELEAHRRAMARRWMDADVELDGNELDQRALRYNIYQLMQACPEHTEHSSIGARGLTGEMYEGSVFWDTEIFMLPFFVLTRPDAARKLLRFRYHTLEQARRHAQSNWFDGAMYGWQVNQYGEEQTPQGVGAYYSIHVIADIAFALLDYWYATGDESFFWDGGLEILLETCRFWASRILRRENGQYEIMAVRGPNEYDVLVNNNLYTNMMARENLSLCLKLLHAFHELDAPRAQAIIEKCAYDPTEAILWRDIMQNIVLPFDEKRNLWLEDDAYLRRKPLDMKRAKPTGKRIIDTTIPYEALPFYQVTKQADVLHVMKNLPWYFTKEQIHIAYSFYQPQTAFDSSLSYSMFALMAARLQMEESALQYYRKTANLDIENVQLNTISGLHFANFGGAWQTVVLGFGGLSVHENHLAFEPHLPKEWSRLRFKLFYHQAQLGVEITATNTTFTYLSGTAPVPICVGDARYTLDGNQPILSLSR